MINKQQVLKITLNMLLASSCIVSIELTGAAEPPAGPEKWAVNQALLAHNLPLVKHLITQNPELAKEGIEIGCSHLHCAISDHLALSFIQWLILAGAPVMSPTTETCPSRKIHLLHTAAQVDYFECIPLLLAHGVNINDRDDEGETPLMHAALFNCISSLRTLIAHGAAINAQDDRGMTALHLALQPQSGHLIHVAPQAAFMLLMHNADTSLANNKGVKALDLPRFDAANVAKEENLTSEYKREFYEFANSKELSRLSSIAHLTCVRSEDQCPVCLETKYLTFWGLCGHQVCATCKNTLFHKEQSNCTLCPLCRQPGIED